jgi:hypothetical protein
MRDYTIYANSKDIIKEIDNRNFDPKRHTIKDSKEFLALVYPIGDDLYKVAGSTDPELGKFYKKFKIIGEANYRGFVFFYPEWTFEQIESNGNGAIEKVISVNLKKGCYVNLSVYKGIIIELRYFEDLIDIEKEERNLDVIIPKFMADKKAKRFKYMKFRQQNLRITAEIETEFGKGYLDIIKYSGDESQIYQVYLYGIKPDNFKDELIWSYLYSGEKPWK